MANFRHRRLSFIVLLALVLTVALGLGLQTKNARATASHAYAKAWQIHEPNGVFSFAKGDVGGEVSSPAPQLGSSSQSQIQKLLASENAKDRERAGQWLFNLGISQPLTSPRRLAAAQMLFDAWQYQPYGQTRRRFGIWITELGYRVQEFTYQRQIGERPTTARDYYLHGPYASNKREPASPAKNTKPPEAGTVPKAEVAANQPPPPAPEMPPVTDPEPKQIQTGVWDPFNPDAPRLSALRPTDQDMARARASSERAKREEHLVDGWMMEADDVQGLTWGEYWQHMARERVPMLGKSYWKSMRKGRGPILPGRGIWNGESNDREDYRCPDKGWCMRCLRGMNCGGCPNAKPEGWHPKRNPNF